MNPFDLLGDNDNEDLSQLVSVQQPKLADKPKKSVSTPQAQSAAKPAPKFPTKPTPPTQAGELPLLVSFIFDFWSLLLHSISVSILLFDCWGSDWKIKAFNFSLVFYFIVVIWIYVLGASLVLSVCSLWMIVVLVISCWWDPLKCYICITIYGVWSYLHRFCCNCVVSFCAMEQSKESEQK